jgi:hypothetical protein
MKRQLLHWSQAAPDPLSHSQRQHLGRSDRASGGQRIPDTRSEGQTAKARACCSHEAGEVAITLEPERRHACLLEISWCALPRLASCFPDAAANRAVDLSRRCGDGALIRQASLERRGARGELRSKEGDREQGIWGERRCCEPPWLAAGPEVGVVRSRSRRVTLPRGDPTIWLAA